MQTYYIQETHHKDLKLSWPVSCIQYKRWPTEIQANNATEAVDAASRMIEKTDNGFKLSAINLYDDHDTAQIAI